MQTDEESMLETDIQTDRLAGGLQRIGIAEGETKT